MKKDFVLIIINEQGSDFENIKELLYPICEAILRVGNILFIKTLQEFSSLEHKINTCSNMSKFFSFAFLQSTHNYKLAVSREYKDVEVIKKPNTENFEYKENSKIQINKTNDADIQEELNRILDKISLFGVATLSQKEKIFLEKYGK